MEVLRKQGMGPTAIGLLIYRSKSTVSREMRRLGTDLPYEAKLNHAAALELRTKARRPTRRTAARLVEIEAGLRQSHSPQQIAGRWKQEGRPAQERLSGETIYQIIIKERRAGGQWYRLLPMRGRKRRRDRTGKKRDRLKIKPEQELAARPERINDRSEFGHWEVDLVIGARQEGVLLVAVERVSRLVRLVFLRNKEADGVADSLVELLSGEVVQSLTYDRGLEWMRHGRIGKALGAENYFCLPYHPWEKGAVEQMNGLIRRYLLKKESFGYDEADHYWLELIEAALNSRPRRVLGYRTPQEMAAELSGQN